MFPSACSQNTGMPHNPWNSVPHPQSTPSCCAHSPNSPCPLLFLSQTPSRMGARSCCRWQRELLPSLPSAAFASFLSGRFCPGFAEKFPCTTPKSCLGLLFYPEKVRTHKIHSPLIFFPFFSILCCQLPHFAGFQVI